MPEDICEKCCSRQISVALKLIINSLNIPILQVTGCLAITIIFAAFYYDFDHILRLHITFTTIGLVLLISEAIMLIANKQFCGTLTDKQNSIIHGFLVCTGIIFTVIGTCILMTGKLSKGEQIMTTTHGITGVISMVFLLLTLILGVILTIYMHALNRVTKIKLMEARTHWLALPHHVLGALGYAIGMVSICYGLATIQLLERVPFSIRVSFIIVTILITTWTMICASAGLCNILNRLVSMYDPLRVLTQVSNKVDNKEVETAITMDRHDKMANMKETKGCKRAHQDPKATTSNC